jgi:Protein of unknown function (DUF3616)
MRAFVLILFGLSSLCAWSEERYSPQRLMQYSGMCDASAAIAVSSNLFLVANDEDNILRLYRGDRRGEALQEFNFNDFLELHGKSQEADLEGAAKIGNRAFWIGSHGRNKDGKDRPNRRRFFATDIQFADGKVQLKPIGKPYEHLLNDLIGDSRFEQFHFAEAAMKAPKEAGALDIEGLSAMPGGHLLIGFRNPVPGGNALLIPLLNPNEVLEGKPAAFGQAIQLNLKGLGIRDIAYHDGAYIIIAGPYNSHGHFQLYRWFGGGAQPEIIKTSGFGDYSPEAIVIYPEKGLQEFQILSDDGNQLMDGIPCKELKDPHRQSFRGFWMLPSGKGKK